MSFHYSAAPAVDCSGQSCLASDTSATSNGTATASRSSRRGSQTAFWKKPRYSEISVSSLSPVQLASTEELRTWLQRAFRASHSALQARDEQAATKPICGPQQPMCFAKFDQATRSLRMSQGCLLPATANESSETWPTSGSMLDGACFQATKTMPRSRESACSSWPTLKASDHAQFTRNLEYFKRRQKIAPDLPVLVALNTPPTPSGFYGRLTPIWCEWLMGFPTGWTALQPLGTHRFHEWLSAHGRS